MMGYLSLRARLALVIVVSLVSPHPISFREGGYFPLAAMLPSLDSWDMIGMFALLFAVYGMLWSAISFALFAPPRRSD